MIDTLQPAALAEMAAQAAAACVPIADPLTLGAATTTSAHLQFDGIAVTARFTGSVSGEILVGVEQSLADALAHSPIGELDVAAALGPAVTAAANVTGSVSVGPGQALPVSVAVEALLSKPGAVIVPLMHGGTVRAVVGLVTADVAAGSAPAQPSYPSAREFTGGATAAPFAPAQISRRGLDLLRDVAMEVTAQIGSTTMTVSELLSLSDGAVIELDRAAGAPADLLVNGHLIARGEVVVVDENFALRITEIVAGDENSVARDQ